MTIELKRESPENYRETETVAREAFWNHFEPGADEHYLVHTMRDSSQFIPELDIVAVDDDKIIGNVMYIKTIIKGDDGVDHDVIGLGPICVLPDYQNKGIGGQLISYTRDLARDMGYDAIFLFGDPDYYSRHGFEPAEEYNIRTEDDMYAAAHQVSLLKDGALSGVKGRYIEGSVYKMDENAVEEYDKTFPFKEKVTGTPTQKKFKKIVAMRKKAR